MELGSLYVATGKVSVAKLDQRPVYSPNSRCYYTKSKNNDWRYLVPGDCVLCVGISPMTNSVKVIFGDFVGWIDSYYLREFQPLLDKPAGLS